MTSLLELLFELFPAPTPAAKLAETVPIPPSTRLMLSAADADASLFLTVVLAYFADLLD